MADEHYGKILHSFWTDPRIKRKLSRDGKLLLAYYFTSPHKNMSGVYYCPIPYVSDETGIDPETVRGLLPALKDFVTFDPETDEVFVHGLAEKAIGEELKAGDTKRKTIERHLAAVHSVPLLHSFQQRYVKWGLRVPIPEQRQTPSPTPPATPSDTPADTRAVEEPSQEDPSNTVLTEPAVAASDLIPHNQQSVMRLVVDLLYFGNRPNEGVMATNGSILRNYAAKRGFEYMARVVTGLAVRRDRGELWGVGTKEAVSLKWLNSSKIDLNQLAVSEDAYYKPDKPGVVGRIGA